MIVNLIKKQQMFSSKLPTKVNGQYWIRDIDEMGRKKNLIEIEAQGGAWVLKSNKQIAIIGESNERLESVILRENVFLNLQIQGDDQRCILVTHPVEEKRQTFEKYLVKGDCVLEIGRSSKNQIIHQNKYISAHHAKIIYQNETWRMEDEGSTNGTYVNGIRAQSRALSVGDLIYIMGLEIIIGKQFIALNNPDGILQINSENLLPFSNQVAEETQEIEGQKEYFYRSPRFKREIHPLKLTIDAPPAKEKLDTVPLALMLGPAITMGMASMGTGAFSVINALNNNGTIYTVMPTILMSVSMLLGTILWPVLTKKSERKRKMAYEKERQEKYFHYLNGVKDQIKRAILEQKQLLEENLISGEECKEVVSGRQRRLWERMPSHDDFLNIRIGTGSLPLSAEIKYPEHKFSMDSDSLQDAMFMLGKEEKILENVPVAVSLIHERKLGIVGSRENTTAFVRNILLQVLTLHSYDEVKIVLLIKEGDIEQWQDLFAVPHIWNSDRSIRYLAANADDMKALSIYLEKEILERIEEGKFDYREETPYFLIVAADKQLAERSEIVQKLITYNGDGGYSVLMLYEEIRNLPKETSAVIEVNETEGKLYDKDDITGKVQRFLPETQSEEEFARVMEQVADIELELPESNYVLPDSITFLEMFHVGKIQHLNALQRWKENNPSNTLQAPVGIGKDGELLYLDLHEKYHGPHGLVAGMTGSGKSEFIITYILSLALNYHPDEAAFILIDYKGGGLAGAFYDEERGIKLPHLAGTITNLDGAAVKRSLISIQSELRRRQAIFNEARKTANEGTMDIYKYQTLYRRGQVKEPVPHLFIISDEFAELKTQQPEFMEQLISAARIGRSLGVHLILATQKPAGVVDDQIWSNSKFRVCLKVQDKADSMDMIKRPDAAELSQTGRFYLQVGFNEYFALGQSAWCGADYIPSDHMEKKADDSVQMIDRLGRILLEEKVKKAHMKQEENIKQIVAVVKYLSQLAEEEGVSVRPLWLPAIPDKIYIEQLCQKYNRTVKEGWLSAAVGEYDDPFNQKQCLLSVDFTEKGSCLIYGAAGNGKTTFLTTLIYSMLRTQSVDFLNLYVLDFGSETLKVFEGAPQVGGIGLAYEREKIHNLMKMLMDEMESRKKLFAGFGGDIQSYLQEAHKAIPNIVVIINNYTGFQEQYEDLEEQLVSLSREGAKYGIYFCLTVNGVNGIRYRVTQNFGQVFTLQLNDRGDYAAVLGNTDGVYPSKYKGRGLVRFDKVYEFQTAYCMPGNVQETLKQFCADLASKTSVRARPVPILPEHVTPKELLPYIQGMDKIPVGIQKEKLQAEFISLQQEYIYLITGQEKMQIVWTACGIAQICSKGLRLYTEIWDAEQLVLPDIVDTVLIQKNFEQKVVELFAEIVERNNVFKDAGMDDGVLESYPRKLFVIAGIGKLLESLSADGRDKLSVFLEKGQSRYKIHFLLADEARQINTISGEGWFRRQVNSANGIWAGNGFADQYLLKPANHSRSLYQEVGEEFGYVLNRGRHTLVKLVTVKREEEDGE